MICPLPGRFFALFMVIFFVWADIQPVCHHPNQAMIICNWLDDLDRILGAFLRSFRKSLLFLLTHCMFVTSCIRKCAQPLVTYHSDRIFQHFHMLGLVNSICIGHSMPLAGCYGCYNWLLHKIAKYGKNQKDAGWWGKHGCMRGFSIAAILSEKNEHHLS